MNTVPQKVGLIATSIDLIHPGYILMLKEAKTVCDYLIIALHDNPSIQRKHKFIPIHTIEERKIILSGIKYIDEIITYKTEEELHNILNSGKININILGSDYLGKEYTGKDIKDIEAYFTERNHTWSVSNLKHKIYKSIRKRILFSMPIYKQITLSNKRFRISDQRKVNMLHGLFDLIISFVNDDFTICEIGSYKGVSSELFATNCKKLYCIDSWQAYNQAKTQEILEAEEKFNNRLKKYKNIIKIKKTSVEASKLFDNKTIDMVYIDANHTYKHIKEDIIHWFPKIKDNGYIAGHDFNLRETQGAIAELFPQYKTASNDINTKTHNEVIIFKDTSWIIKKTDNIKYIGKLE